MVRYNKGIAVRWLRKKQQGVDLKDFFIENHYYNVVLYYWNEMSELLVAELADSSIQVVGVIDDRVNLKIGIPVYKEIGEAEKVDLIVICTALHTMKIEEKLRQQVSCAVITMLDLV